MLEFPPAADILKKGTQQGWFLLDHISSAMSQEWGRQVLIQKAILKHALFFWKITLLSELSKAV